MTYKLACVKILEVPKIGTPLIATKYKGGTMEKSMFDKGQQPSIIETAEGLEDQSFFYASEQPDIKIPTRFIMQRMLRVE